MKRLHDPVACHDSSLLLQEPLWGTADQVDAWILLEYRGEWTQQAIVDNDLDAKTNDWLKQTLRNCFALGLRPRPLFIRQPEISREGVTVMLCLCGRIQPLLFRFDVGGHAEIAHLDLGRCAADPARFVQAAWHDPQYLVCANARRDQCCARYGVPVYMALRERLGERIWQCTHVGGHRFAPNVLKLPDGALFGRVNVGDIGAFIAVVESGGVPARWLRGRTAYPFHVQAAEAMLGDRHAPAKLLGEEALAEDRWRVRFEQNGGERELHVGLAEPKEILASCRDVAPKPVRSFVQLP
jgi:hypothetical protein